MELNSAQSPQCQYDFSPDVLHMLHLLAGDRLDRSQIEDDVHDHVLG